jgi:hypothetical protein
MQNRCSVGVLVGRERMNGGDEGEGIWLLNFISKHKIGQ